MRILMHVAQLSTIVFVETTAVAGPLFSTVAAYSDALRDTAGSAATDVHSALHCSCCSTSCTALALLAQQSLVARPTLTKSHHIYVER